MHVHPYLNFNGQCKEAFEFYAQNLGGTIEAMMPFGNTPAAQDLPDDSRDLIMHARMTVGNSIIMASDATPDQYQAPKGTYLSLHITDPAEADRAYNALAEGGSIEVPIQETFWAARFGMLTDRFGIPWMINCDKAA